MSNQYNINLEFRPSTYWPAAENREQRLAHIQGQVRRDIVWDALESGGISELNSIGPEISAELLSGQDRQAWGSFHPSFLGGEYLPAFHRHDVEIARVALKSVTMDVISIRARKTKHRIVYSIVDEYPEYEFDYTKARKTSVKPLTLGQLISFMDNAQEGGLVGGARESNYQWSGDAEELYDFGTASSAFYPELGAWYDIANEEWLNKELGAGREELEREELESEYHDRFLDGKDYASEDEKQWRHENRKALI